MPWMSLLEGEEMPSDVTVRLKAGLVEARTLTVNASPIISTGDKVQRCSNHISRDNPDRIQE